MRLESIHNALGNDFVDDVAKANRTVISWDQRHKLIRD
jgi:hypothetical protein